MTTGDGIRILEDGRWLLAPGVSVWPAALRLTAARSGGPGGQHVNTASTRVELRLALDAITGLDQAGRARLAQLAGQRLTEAGELVLHCGATRSQAGNRALVLRRLTDLVGRAAVPPRPRRATTPGPGARKRRLQTKALRSAAKTRRRKAPSED